MTHEIVIPEIGTISWGFTLPQRGEPWVLDWEVRVDDGEPFDGSWSNQLEATVEIEKRLCRLIGREPQREDSYHVSWKEYALYATRKMVASDTAEAVVWEQRLEAFANVWRARCVDA